MDQGKLTQGPVGRRLREMAVPMFFGIAAVILFSVVDTYFVGQIVGSMNRTRPAGQVVLEIVEEFIDATEALARQLEF